MRSLLLRLSLGALPLLAQHVSADLPYNPTRLFLPTQPDGHDLVYAFAPPASSSASSSDLQLLTLNVSSKLDSASLPLSTLSASLPFLQNGEKLAMTPMMDGTGNISVFAGDCSSGQASGSSLWRFVLDQGRPDKGSWVEQKADASGQKATSNPNGANFLASGVSFSTHSEDIDRDSTFYVFGGMCPTAASSSSTSWTASANYSNAMLKLTGETPTLAGDSSSPSSPTTFDLGIAPSRGPPIPEAGFSVTPLPPSSTNSSSGGVQTQQQNFLLIGGHTQYAFINTSQIALFSLPEESWAFIPVNGPLPTGKTDLAIRQPDQVEPRSGHTAVLTADGSRVIVLGGWVGDISTPAEPQLAVLDLGEGYGGSGDWKWGIPSMTGPGLDDGAGLYGHGAIMLPGDVMMVLGGYSIPAASKSRFRRAQSTGASSKAYFLNVTSNTWSTSYSNPGKDAQSSSAKSSGAVSHTSQKAALGSGLSIGLAAIVGVVLLWFWYSRRLKKQRQETREKELRELGFTAQRLDGPQNGAEQPQMEQMGGRLQPGADGLRWSSNSQGGFGEGPGWKENGGSQAERTGLLMEIPSPTRGLRRSLHSRSRSERSIPYQLAPGFDENRHSLAGSIHPIDERDEYEQPVMAGGPPDGTEVNVVTTAPVVDPFRDPDPLGSHPISLQATPASPAQERELEIGQWVSDWEAADALMHSGAGRASPGRSSPDKDRTSSTLSEQSASNVSAISQPYSLSSISRSISQRSAALFSGTVNPFSSSNTSPTLDYPGASAGAGRDSPPQQHHRRTRSQSMFSQGGAGGVPNNASFVTARSSFPQLQAEGESLLPRPTHQSPPESPVKTTGATSKYRRSGWMGSMRRALPFSGGGERSPSPGDNATSGSASPTSPARHSPSPTRDSPRRTASAGGAMYWRRQQGAADWDVTGPSGEARPHGARGRGSTIGVGGQADSDWDVEAAVENRVVQLMFTVPKGALRVVNGEVGDEEERQDDEGEGIGVGAASAAAAGARDDKRKMSNEES